MPSHAVDPSCGPFRAWTRLGLLCLALAAGLPAQGVTATGTGNAKPDLGAPAALPTGAPPQLQHITREGLREHTLWLAADERAGRYTGSRHQQEVAKYFATHFQKLGLKPLGDKRGFLQSYPLQRTFLEPSTVLQFGENRVQNGFAVFGVRDEEKHQLSGRFAYCGNGSGAQVPASLQGRLPVVVLQQLGKGQGAGSDLQAVQRFHGIADKLRGAGASVGIVCLLDDQGSAANTLNYYGIQPEHPRLRQPGGRSRQQAAALPLFVLNATQGRKLLEYCGAGFDENGQLTQPPEEEKASGKLVLGVKTDDKATGSNVVAVSEGKGKKAEAIVYSAHHDHIGQRLDGDAFNGADDNASGSAGLLAIAEAFAKGGERPERSIIFLSVSGEELGLWGSEWYAEHPTWPLDKIIANINIDMIGRAGGGEGGEILMQVTPSHQHEKYSTLVREGVQLGEHFGLRWSSGDQYYQRSDHYNFAKRGVPVVFYCDGEHPDYHQVSDHADRLDYVRMEAIARLAFWTGWNTAQNKSRPQELGRQASW